MKIRELRLFLVCFFIAGVCFGQKVNKPSYILASSLDSLMTDFYKRNIFVGTVLVAKKGEIIFQKGFGNADLEWSIPNQSDTKFGIASLTKPFTALRLLQLADSGVIDLNDKISKYVPQFKGKAGENITIKELITHTSGFKEHVDLDPAIPETIINRSDSVSMIEKMKLLIPYALLTAEKNKFHYSSDGYALLGWIIEIASGKSFEENIRIITNKAEMYDTGIFYHKNIITRRARSYQREGGQLINSPYEDASENQGAGGLYSTVGDLLKFDRALKNGTLISKRTTDLITVPYIDSWNIYGFSRFSYGWWIDKDEKIGRITMHPGASPNYCSVLLRGIDTDFCIIALSNTSSISNMGIYTEALLRIVKESF